ncbi:MAG: excinuclease ABC subunit UvrB [Flavobacteriales bacterium]|nr:excinuclease ABC subunit UvrB [Flavobacteriales bacterium]NCG29590.1 excinuclease ABC subunit UvrB [Bacteroidota bacterium]MBT3963660.1 excinuclease ABC subunit UvrB [Flavobacteriales bacterium]MBT4705807.1 excinuclease ABC subunit UvrB [Flavobacteriales bacterium]MBT4929937.1 excinuclease ABC subunit UvrB [Flavobacteriales bacterium]
MEFKLNSDFSPTGDQPGAIAQLVSGINDGIQHQTLLGVTGSGKTFTMANIINETQRPTLILSHNKTLAAQLYGEFKQFFPENRVEYFVSYYDYYQPEAYVPTSDLYIEKDLSINAEIEKLRLSTTSALLSGRKDVIVVSSVSCIYGMGNPSDFHENIIQAKRGEMFGRNKFLHRLVESLYSRTTGDFKRGNFRVKGDTVDVFLAYADHAFRFHFFGEEIELIESIDPFNHKVIEELEEIRIFPANIFVTTKERMRSSMVQIQDDLVERMDQFVKGGQPIESKRLEDRVNYDLEMMRELGYCSGIENYSRYFDGRHAGDRPFCLLDYFPDNYLMFIDESHVSVSQVSAMYGGDRSRKENLVEYGFRLPSALDNRPLKFEEFETLQNQVIYVSATPADYELRLSEGVIAEQLIRPTGLLDPIIEIRPSANQIDDLLEEIRTRIEAKERVLVTTLTKRMAEEMAKYLRDLDIKTHYIHSDVDTLERVEILRDLRMGKVDVLVGINLLREGLDLPEVSLVAIIDADKEGFLRSNRSLTQTIGRAARHINGKAILYADKVTDSMSRTIEETNRRREKQLAYNVEHGITPKAIKKSFDALIHSESSVRGREYKRSEELEMTMGLAADPIVEYMSAEQLEKAIRQTRSKMEKASKELDFQLAALLRDEMFAMQEKLKDKK